MNMKQHILCLRRLMAAGAMLVLLLTGAVPSMGTPVTVEETPVAVSVPEGYSLMAENDALRLYADERFSVALEKKETGEWWYSVPVNCEQDELAKAKIQLQMQSAMLVTFVNEAGASDVSASYTSSVKKGGATMYRVENGFRVEYDFPKEEFTVPLEIMLDGDALCCRILTQEITERGQNRVQKIELFPYFGAGSTADNGYVIVPDGCGARMNFNNGKIECAQYNEKIYGRDVNFDLIRSFSNKQPIYLPIFGIRKNDAALLAVVTEGAAAGSVKAGVSGRISSYNTVACEFELLAVDSYTMGETVGSRVKQVSILQDGTTTYDTLAVCYFPLSGEQANYAGMATRYRQYLIEKQGLKQSTTGDSVLFLETLGAIRKEKSVLGFPVTLTQPITKFAAAQKMLADLKGRGVDRIALQYNRADNASVYGKPASKIALCGKLGGKSGYSALRQAATVQGATVYLNTEWQMIEKWGNGFSSFRNAAKIISGNPAQWMPFNIATRFKDKTKAVDLLRMSSLTKLSERLDKSLTKAGITAIGTGSAGNLLYSDFAQADWNRQDSAEAITVAAQLLATDRQMLVSGGNAYLLPMASGVIDVPACSSEFDVMDETIPLMAIVLRGYVDFASTPVNLSSDSRGMLLNAIETGAMLHYYILDNSNNQIAQLQDTVYTKLFSADYDAWKDTIAAQYKELTAALADVKGATITGHERLPSGVTRTIYDNGVSYLVNATDESVTEQGITVEARGFVMLKGGDSLAE